MALIHDIFAALDIFSFPVFFHMNKQSTYKSWMGGCGTIFMVVCFFLFFWSRFAQFIFMERVFTNEEEQYDTSPGQIDLEKDNFMFAVNVEGQDYSSPDGVQFDIVLEQKHRSFGSKTFDDYTDVNSQGKEEVFTNLAKEIKLELCTKSHFKDIEGLDKEAIDHVFETDGFGSWLCPEKEAILKLGGVFTSKTFLYLQLAVHKCVDQEHNDYKCSTVEIDPDFTYKLNFYHTNFLVNKNADFVPVETYISDFLYFKFKPKSVLGWADIYFRQYFIKTWDNVWGYKGPLELKFPIFKQGDLREYPEYIDNGNDIFFDEQDQPRRLIEVNIRRSPFSHNVERSYEKIDQFLAYVGGFIATLIGVFGGGLAFFKKQSYLVELSNQIYQFKRDDFEKIKMENQKSRMSSTIKKQSLKNDDGKPLKDKYTRGEYLQQEFQNYYNLRRPLQMTFKYYIAMIFCKKICYGPEEKLIDAALQKVADTIDIKTILKNQYMNQKGTDVSLGKKQRELLQLIPKLDVTKEDYKELPGLCEKVKQMKGKSAQQIFEQDQEFQEQFSVQHINELYQAYEQALDTNQDPEIVRLNRRILKQIKKIDPELIKIFEDARKQDKQFEKEKKHNLTKKQKKKLGITDDDVQIEMKSLRQDEEAELNNKEEKNEEGEQGEGEGEKKKSGCQIF